MQSKQGLEEKMGSVKPNEPSARMKAQHPSCQRPQRIHAVLATCAAVLQTIVAVLVTVVVTNETQKGAAKASRGRRPSQKLDSWMRFAESHGCLSLNSIMYDRIYTDLAPWKTTGISHALLSDFASQNAVHVLRFHNASFYGEMGPALGTILNPIAPLLGSASFQFAINYYDEPILAPLLHPATYTQPGQGGSPWDSNACLRARYAHVQNSHGFWMHPQSLPTRADTAPPPVLSHSSLACFRDVLFPLDYHAEVAAEVVLDRVAWADKDDVVFWRGATTGGAYVAGAPWLFYHRTRLVQWAKGRKEVWSGNKSAKVDVAFNSVVQSDFRTRLLIEQKFGLQDTVSFKQTIKYKFLIVVDGNTFPSRLQRYLQTNSVVLYNGVFRDWWNWRLEPWVHYVPFRLDCSDLEDRIKWLMNHDEEARMISRNARALMEQVNSMGQLQCYAGLLLFEYSNLYRE